MDKKAKYLTSKQAADVIGVSPGRVRQLILQGRLKTKRFGKAHQILSREAERFVRGSVGRPVVRKKNQKKVGN